MDWDMILAVIAIIEATATLGGLIYGFVFWLGGMKTKVDTLYKIYVEGRLSEAMAGGFAKSSAFVITKVGEASIPDFLKSELDSAKESYREYKDDPYELFYQVARNHSTSIKKAASDVNLSFDTMLALATLFLLKRYK